MAEENKYNILVECGTDFVLPFTWYDENDVPYDLTGATVEAHLRESDSDPDYYEFACVHNGAGGKITMRMLHEVTAQIDYSYGVYDVFVTFPDGTQKRPLYGDVYVKNNVTKLSDGTILFITSITKYSDLPSEGNVNRIYFVKENGSFYRWNGLNYVFIGTYNGITSIVKTGSTGTETTGVLDSYRINFSDGDYFDYTVRNGRKGEKGDKGDIANPDEILAQLGQMAFVDVVDYKTQIANKPKLKELAYKDYIDYDSDNLRNKPEPIDVTIDRLRSLFPQMPLPILIAIYLADETLYLDSIGTYDSEHEAIVLPDEETSGVTFEYIPETESLKITVTGSYVIDDAPSDGNFYARRNGAWVTISGGGGSTTTVSYDSVNEALVFTEASE